MIKSLFLEEKWSAFQLENAKAMNVKAGTGAGATPPPINEPPSGGEEEEGNNKTTCQSISFLHNI
ncbi:MAG: hypothetical protein WBB45_02795 [Cyclobacteriaceae bacterium]